MELPMSVVDEARTTDGPETVPLWAGDRIRAWQDYHLSGMPELISAFNLCHALRALATSGLLDHLRDGCPHPAADLLAGIDPLIGPGFIRYLTVTGVLEAFDDTLRLTRRGTMLTGDIALARLGFYLEAYGSVSRRAGDLLTGAATYGVDVVRDHGALGRYSGVISSTSYLPIVHEAMLRERATNLVDLGCGDGSLLIELCERHPELAGVGLDLAPAAIEIANERAERAGVADRVTFAVADAFDPATWPAATRSAEVICGVGVLHEKFRDGDAAVVALLDRFADMLDGDRMLLLGEPELRYDNCANDSDFFLVHVLTRQGIPRDRDGWLAVFAQSRLRCRRLYDNAVAGPRTCFYELTAQR